MPFEDFIMAVDSVLCDAIDNTLGTLLDRNENKDIDLLVWNCIDEVNCRIWLSRAEKRGSMGKWQKSADFFLERFWIERATSSLQTDAVDGPRTFGCGCEA